MTQTKSSLLQNKHSSEAGFTLVELAIVIIILGILLAAFFFGLTIFLKQKQAEDERTRFDDITIAMSKFVFDEPEVDADNDGTPDNIYDSDGDNVLDSPNDPVRYPCPARLTLPPTDAGYGRERCPTPAEIAGLSAGDELGGAGGGIFALSGTGGNLVLIGAIPAATIGESTDIMVDEFGNLIFYAVSLNVMNGDSALLTDPGPGAITILDANGNPRTITSNFAIFSAGEDGAGAYSSFGVPNGTPCRTPGTAGAGDSQNCLWQTTNIATFRQQLGRTDGLNLAATDDFYDDRLVFTFRNEDDDEGWWVATDDSGTDITHKNDGNILIQNASRIGIGNTTPDEEIHVTGTWLGAGADPARIMLNNDDNGTGTDNYGTYATLMGDGGIWLIRPTDATDGNVNGYIRFGVGDNLATGELESFQYDYVSQRFNIGGDRGSNVIIGNGNNINNQSYLGIGTNAPTEEIHVEGQHGASPARILVTNTNNGSGTSSVLKGDGGIWLIRPTNATDGNVNGYLDFGTSQTSGKTRIWYDFVDNKLHVGSHPNYADTTFLGNVGIFPGNGDPPDPEVALDVSGAVKIADRNSGGGTNDGDCSGSTRGALRYNSSRDQMEFCSASGWRSTSSPAPGDCTVRTFSGGAGGVTGTCNADEYLVSGGGECGTINGNTTGLGYFHYNRPQGTGNSWATDCFSPVSSVAQNVSGSTGSEDGLSGDHSHSFNINVPSDTASAGNPNSTVSIICCKR